jgi:cytoskeletal protein RodZ
VDGAGHRSPPAGADVATFGEKLRQRREERGISLDAISKTTKISTRLLRALEEERFDQLPGGVFNKGFVRAYARQVGLNETETVGDYLDALRESQIQEQEIRPELRGAAAKRSTGGNGADAAGATERRLESRRKRDRRTNERRIENRRMEDRRATRSVNEDSRPYESRVEDSTAEHSSTGDGNGDRESIREYSAELENFLSPVSLPPADRPAAETFTPSPGPSIPLSRKLMAVVALVLIVFLAAWAFHRSARPAPQQTASAANQLSPSISAPPQPSLPALILTPKPVGTPTAVSRAAPTASEATPATANSAAHPSAPPPLKAFTVIIRANETTPISVLADGESVIRETLIAPAATSVHASHDVIVKAGNSAAISFLLNGKLIQPQGNEGEAKTYVLNASGLVAAPQSQSPASNP